MTEGIERGRKEIGVVDAGRRRQRDSQAQSSACQREPALGGERPRQRPTIAVEGRVARPSGTDAKLDRQVRPFRDAKLVGADEIVEPDVDRHHDTGLRRRRHPQVREQDIVALEYIVHQAQDEQSVGYRILEGAGLPSGRRH